MSTDHTYTTSPHITRDVGLLLISSTRFHDGIRAMGVLRMLRRTWLVTGRFGPWIIRRTDDSPTNRTNGRFTHQDGFTSRTIRPWIIRSITLCVVYCNDKPARPLPVQQSRVWIWSYHLVNPNLKCVLNEWQVLRTLYWINSSVITCVLLPQHIVNQVSQWLQVKHPLKSKSSTLLCGYD